MEPDADRDLRVLGADHGGQPGQERMPFSIRVRHHVAKSLRVLLSFFKVAGRVCPSRNRETSLREQDGGSHHVVAAHSIAGSVARQKAHETAPRAIEAASDSLDEGPVPVHVQYVNLAGDPLFRGEAVLEPEALRKDFIQRLHGEPITCEEQENEASDLVSQGKSATASVEDFYSATGSSSTTRDALQQFRAILEENALGPEHTIPGPRREGSAVSAADEDSVSSGTHAETSEPRPLQIRLVNAFSCRRRANKSNDNTVAGIETAAPPPHPPLYCRVLEANVRALETDQAEVADLSKFQWVRWFYFRGLDSELRILWDLWSVENELDTESSLGVVLEKRIQAAETKSEQEKERLQQLLELTKTRDKELYSVRRKFAQSAAWWGSLGFLLGWSKTNKPKHGNRPDVLEIFFDVYGQFQVFFNGAYEGVMSKFAEHGEGAAWVNQMRPGLMSDRTHTFAKYWTLTGEKKAASSAGSIGPAYPDAGTPGTSTTVYDPHDAKSTSPTTNKASSSVTRKNPQPTAFRFLHRGECCADRYDRGALPADVKEEDIMDTRKKMLLYARLHVMNEYRTPAARAKVALTQNKCRGLLPDDAVREKMLRALKELYHAYPHDFHVLAPYAEVTAPEQDLMCVLSCREDEVERNGKKRDQRSPAERSTAGGTSCRSTATSAGTNNDSHSTDVDDVDEDDDEFYNSSTRLSDAEFQQYLAEYEGAVVEEELQAQLDDNENEKRIPREIEEQAGGSVVLKGGSEAARSLTVGSPEGEQHAPELHTISDGKNYRGTECVSASVLHAEHKDDPYLVTVVIKGPACNSTEDESSKKKKEVNQGDS
ncbi:unnamed protein product [Amoebophrya sp. A120]|nr:unnamed protein product [Amoebophrya sp. A120]|eukprot:GSA120T00003981001.1